MIHLFFFMEVVLTQGVGQPNLGNISKLDEPSSLSSFSSTCNGTREGGVVSEEMGLLRRSGACHHCPLSLKSPRSPGWGDARESSVSGALSAWRGKHPALA